MTTSRHVSCSTSPTLTISPWKGFFLAFNLLFWQPTAIKALIDFENKFGLGLLSEEVGLGKTLETICLLLYRSNERRKLLAEGKPVPRAKPTILLMLRNLINQWKDEILKFTNPFKVIIYYGAGKKTGADGVEYFKGKFTRESDLFNGDEANADTLVISAYTTWGARHGPRVQRRW